MKIYISLDMEGIAGTYNWAQERNHGSDVRGLMEQQISWLVEGIQKSHLNNRVDRIVISDSHNRGDNLRYTIAEMDRRIEIISGGGRPQYMMSGIHREFDGVILAGYHCASGKLHASMDHTYSARTIHEIFVNGTEFNEALLSAAYAGELGIPVGFITGDQAFYDELQEKKTLLQAEFVNTKKGLGRFAAQLKNPIALRQETIEKMDSFLTKLAGHAYSCFKVTLPLTLEIGFMTSSGADMASLVPGCRRLSGRKIGIQLNSMKETLDCIMAMAILSSVE